MLKSAKRKKDAIDHWTAKLTTKGYGYSIKGYADLVDELGLEDASSVVNLAKNRGGSSQISFESSLNYIENILNNEFELAYENESDRDIYTKYFILMAYAFTKKLGEQVELSKLLAE